MGEAKRRREAQQKSVSVTDDDVIECRSTGITPTKLLLQLQLLAWAPEAVATVPCRGCRECCWYNKVTVDPQEEPAANLKHLDIVIDDTDFVLRKREDGACIHLGDNGCTVYPHRPRACRQYDCRVGALGGITETYTNGHEQPMWDFRDTPTITDRAILMAARLALMPYMISAVSTGVPSKAPFDEMLKAMLGGLQQHLPVATDFVTKLDALPPQERAKLDAYMRAAGADIAQEYPHLVVKVKHEDV